MALEGTRQEQQQEEPEQQQQEEQQERGELGGGGGSPDAGSDISSSDTEAGEPKPPLYPLLTIPVPPELADSAFVDAPVDIDHHCKVPHGWQRCLSLKTGKIFYKDPFDWEDDDDMSRNGKNARLDLRLNLSANRGSSSGTAGGSNSNNNNNNNNNNNHRRGNNNSPHRSSSSSSSPASPPSSCVSSETEQEQEPSAMVLVGCPHCLMYVMLSEEDPRCPKCKSTVLLDFLNDPKKPGPSSTRKPKKN